MTEVLVAMISGGFGLVGVVLSIGLPRLFRRLDALHEQVTNSHGTNLRDDIDYIRDVVLDVRADVAWVRRDHTDLTHRVDRLEGVA